MTECKILLVDDDIEDYLIMKEAFTNLGVDETLEYASNGKQALDKLDKLHRTNGKVPDIIVLDINMPVMNGLVVLAHIRNDERFARIPVVIYSTAINPNFEKQCEDLGVEYCIPKPHTMAEIIRVGETLLALCHKLDPLTTPDIS